MREIAIVFSIVFVAAIWTLLYIRNHKQKQNRRHKQDAQYFIHIAKQRDRAGEREGLSRSETN